MKISQLEDYSGHDLPVLCFKAAYIQVGIDSFLPCSARSGRGAGLSKWDAFGGVVARKLDSFRADQPTTFCPCAWL